MNLRSGAQPLFSFLTIVVLGVIIAVEINQDESLRAPIILVSVLFGFIVTIFELRIISRQSKMIAHVSRRMSKEEREQKLALMVAEAFKEDFVDELIEEEVEEDTKDLDQQDPRH